MNTSQKIRDTQGVSRIFWLFYRWARRSGAEEAIEAVTAYRGGHGLSGRRWAKARRTNRNVKERWNLDISDWQTSNLPPLHKFHKKTLVCIRRILRVLVRCAEKSFDVPNVYMIRRNIL